MGKVKQLLKKAKHAYWFYQYCRSYRYQIGAKLVSDKREIQRKFRKKLHRDVELVHPVMFNDKLQYLKLYWYDERATICADKYMAREYVKRVCGDEILNEMYGVYDDVNEIDIQKLPDSFVLKATHASGYNILCKDKSKIDWDTAFREMKLWLKTNFYHRTREWVYKDIKPRIICERYLSDIANDTIMDYKIYCFNGEPRMIHVDMDRFGKHKKNYYDLDWNYRDVSVTYPNDPGKKIDKPERLDEMLAIAKRLSAGFPHVRIDLYYLSDEQKILFGEMTFFNGNGYTVFTPPAFEAEMGSYLVLP